jgi:ATP-dependent Lon protease
MAARVWLFREKRIFKIDRFTQRNPIFVPDITTIRQEMDISGVELDASIRSIKETASKIVNLSPKYSL